MKFDLSLNKISETDFWKGLKKICEEKKYSISLVEKAYNTAFNVHYNEIRESGEMYIAHPVWMAKIAAQMDLGIDAVIACLFHKAIENDKDFIKKAKKEYGSDVFNILSGLTKVNKQTKKVKVNHSSMDYYKHFIISSVEDIRVLIIRIIDKIHDTLTIDYLPQNRRLDLAKRVMTVYVPLCEYVGLMYFKRILEDKAFLILYPKEYAKTLVIVKERRRKEVKTLYFFEKAIREDLEKNGIKNFEIQARLKSLYSSYLKIKNKGIERLKDRVGFRIIVNSIKECYTTLGILHSKYRYLKDEFDDYISDPKPNGYQSIKTALLWKHKLTVEVQIRTKTMHEYAEYGPAAHISYKDPGEVKDYVWMKNLLNWQSQKNYQIKVMRDYIYVFTPKRDIYQLEKNSTVKDFAYKIHSNLGHHCAGGKVNGKRMSKNTILKTGDVVEIIRSRFVKN